MNSTAEVVRSAVLSSCGFYRYQLLRVWNGGLPLCNFVLLNPSTADAQQDDPTVIRCMQRARLTGFGGVVLTNLYALRSTDPRALRSHEDPVGRECDAHLHDAAVASAMVICGWGVHGDQGRPGRVSRALDSLRNAGAELHVLKLTADGHPSHPLYLPYHLMPQRWLPPEK